MQSGNSRPQSRLASIGTRLASSIDLSAWLSGLAYGLGIALTGGESIAAALAEGSPFLWLLPASYLAFLLAVLLIQRHMRLSLLASSFGKPANLVTSGIFRLSRNPIYVAFLLPLATIAVLSPLAALAAMAFYVAVMTVTVIRREETQLARLFGEEFMRYMERTPRWV